MTNPNNVNLMVNSLLWWLIPIAILLAGVFLAAFISQVNDGQLDDLETPPQAILLEDQE